MGFDSRKNLIIWVVIVLVGLNLFAWGWVFQESRSSFLRVIFFDVGQGSAVLIETPQKTQILVDGGPGPQIVERLGQALPFFDRSLDLIVSTHPDFDHLAGLVEVLKSYRVGAVAGTGVRGQTAEYEEFLAEAERERADQIVLKKGQVLRAGSDLKIEVLAPLEDFAGREVKDYNRSSLVLKVSYGQTDFLLTGDSPVSVEKELVEKMRDKLDIEVLQVGHHGSQSSTSQAWLEATSPEIAVIQVGQKNKYGHPSQEVLEKLKSYGIKILRTDETGDIRFLSDGYAISLISN
ncbi:MAG: MBL fold metallo-hydrolase [Candidatus Nealsonbacteria bacterium]|nr:MBL fold metallo-hydrolase [Candidatus Nealsonbacteria bacterium]